MFRISVRQFAGIFIVIVLSGIVFTYWSAGAKDAEMRENILAEARLATAGITAGELMNLTGSESDLAANDYVQLKERMAAVRFAVPGCTFSYLMGRNLDGTIFLYVDSEPPGSVDYSPPGQEYPEAPADVAAVFESGSPAIAGPYEDRWGSWVSAYVPITDPGTGTVAGVFGMDIGAGAWARDIAIACIAPIMVTLFVLDLLLLFFVLQQRNERETQLLRESEKALQESERRLRQIISFLPDAMFAIDRESRVIAWNRAIEEMTGVPAADMIGKGEFEYSVPFYGSRRPALIDLVFSPQEEVRQNYSDVRVEKDGITAEALTASPLGKETILWSRASPLYDSEGNLIGAIESIRDVTEQRRVADSLRQANRKLHLLSSITRHDVINKLTACFGFIALAKKQSDNPRTKELLDRLQKNASDIRNQINFTKLYQEIGVTGPVWQDLPGLVAGLQPGGLAVAAAVDGIGIYADPMLPLVFSTLLDNTIRHGGHATQVAISARETAGGLIVFFEDDGTGIPADEKEQIFERGYGKNTGLGLFLAREILAITGIGISETGEPGKGARFEIRVPEGAYRLRPKP